MPQSNTLSFQYVFASDEYNEYVASQFNDVFGFFVNGQNVAKLPGTNTNVSINNVNNGCSANCRGTNPVPTNPQFFRNNDRASGAPLDTEMDGMTVVLSINATVNPGVANRIKLAVADAGDSALDSAVFIKAGSLASGCATTRLNPSNPTVGVGSTLPVAIVVDTTCNIDRAEVHLNFDPTKLSVAGNTLTPGTSLAQVITNTASSTLGTIDYVVQQPGGIAPGTFTLATINFNTLAQTGPGGSPVSFIFGGSRNTDISFAGASKFGGATDGLVKITDQPATVVGGKVFSATTKTNPLQVYLSWQGGNGQIDYQLLRVPLSGGAQTTQTLPGSATSFTDTNVVQGGFYCYLLTARNAQQAAIGVTDPLCGFFLGSSLTTSASAPPNTDALQQAVQMFEGLPRIQ